MAEPPLSSTDSDGSHESNDDSVIISNGKSQVNNNKTNKRNTRLNLKIPKLASSDSGNDLSSCNSSGKASKSLKRKPNYCSTSASESESDASLSDLYKKVTSKKKPSKKSKIEKSKTSKKEKSSKAEKKNKTSAQSNNEEEDEVETRKNIHKIMTNSKLSIATKTSAQLESDRRKRIEERQKEYNKDVPDEDILMTSSNITMVLEKDQDDNSIVEVDKLIVDNLKPHQMEAVQFLWDCVIRSVECLEKSQQVDSEDDKNASAVGGCVLAHCMGLGKTLSLIAFMHTMLTTSCLKLRTCLVVCPVNTALNWKKEWEMWMPKEKLVNIFEVCSTECKKSKVQVVQDWYHKGGVLIIGYEMYRLLATGDSRTVRRKIVKQKLNEALVEPGPDFVVCDEGHLLKNNKSAINKVITKIFTRRRIVLTGTPLQNKLLEYHTMVQFVKPNLLGTQKEFLNRFVNPINNGQHINSTPYDVSLMKKRSHILFKMLDGCVHRRDYSALVKYLPPKYEYVVKIRLSDIQVQLYRQYISICKDNKHSLFQDHLTFSRIWTRPFVICMHQEIMDKKMFFVDTDEDGDDSFINDTSDSDSKDADDKKPVKTSNGGDVINLISDDSDLDGSVRKKSKIEKREKSNSGSDSSAEEVVRNWGTTSRSAKKNELVDSDEEPIITGIKELKELKYMNPIDKHWWSNIIQPEHEHQIEISGKLSVLFQILRKASDIGDKIIIFSHSLLVLDIIEKYLQELHTIAEKIQEDLKKLNDSIDQSPTTAEEDIIYNSWIKGLDYDRMDGSTQAFVRADIQSRFNSFEDHRLRLFLISTRAGGMGVNLVAANRVIIFDVSWNPSHDVQAIFRSYRFGQNKPVYVYRFVSQGTMEEKIYERQVTKQSLSLRVVDEQQISRYFTEEDLRSLYKFEPDLYDPEKVRETPILPKDRFLAELIQELPQFIHGYHEHDSLLQNKTDEELTETERQDAWKEFEEEKIRGYRPFPMNPIQPKPAMDQDRMHQLQIMMLQQYPQYAALYAQNYNNLVKYVLSRKPDLNQIQLNNEVQHLFLQSLQKYYNSQATMMVTQPADTIAGSSQSMQ
uniref:X-linked nuclear protein n=1 Tax=Dugesia japonica TaxID=6161 RepID=Q868M6_DUGJA|nr:X-linked nuclear protein [Dugesia japonica]